jgi:putative methionine-R-sulfoxide reductase with GAF domain
MQFACYTCATAGGCGGLLGDITIDAIERDQRASAGSTSTRDWPAITAWAQDLAVLVSTDQPTEHVAVFVADEITGDLRLAAQVWGAGEDTGAVRVGEWTIPFEESICGRVFRTGVPSLCSDVSFDADYRSFPGGRARSSLTVPVGPPGAVVAVVNVEAPWIGAFTIRHFERLTEQAAAALDLYPLARAI